MHEILQRFDFQLPRRLVKCKSEEDRNLIRDAKSIADDPAAANFTIGRLHLVKDACQRYALGGMQRLVKRAIDGIPYGRSDASPPNSTP